MQNTRITKLLEFLEQDPNDAFVLYALATEYNNLNDKAQALAYYLKLTEMHPGYVGTYYHLGKLYETLSDTGKAVEAYQSGMKAAREKRDMHALSELQGAYNKAMGLDYEDD